MPKTTALLWVSPQENLPPADTVVLTAVRDTAAADWTYKLAIYTPEGDDSEGDYQAEKWEDSVGEIEIDPPAFWSVIPSPEGEPLAKD